MAGRRYSYSFRFKIVSLKKMDENGGNVKKTEMDMNVSRQNIMRWRGERAEIFKLNEPPDAQRRKYR